MLSILNKKDRRKQRLRSKLRMISDRPRLSVFRSGKHIYAQVIVDGDGVTKASASTLADLKDQMKNKAANKDLAMEVGKLVAKRALEQGISEVSFDKGHHLYHGQVASLAAGAREAGLKF